MMLTGKSIIVTGAGSGIGKGTAQVLAKAGAKVLVTDYDGPSAEETAALVEEQGGVARAMRIDVSNEEDVIAMVAAAVDAFGKLDGAFNNAGVRQTYELVPDLTVNDWDKIMGVNLRGVFLCMKHEIAAMRKTGGGAIVNTSSGLGVTGAPYSAEYAASKHGVIGVTRGAACEAALTGVRVNVVLPGLVETKISAKLITDPDLKDIYDKTLARHPIGRIGQPEDIGYAVKWLLSDEAGFVNGAAIAVDGGYTAC